MRRYPPNQLLELVCFRQNLLGNARLGPYSSNWLIERLGKYLYDPQKFWWSGIHGFTCSALLVSLEIQRWLGEEAHRVWFHTWRWHDVSLSNADEHSTQQNSQSASQPVSNNNRAQLRCLLCLLRAWRWVIWAHATAFALSNSSYLFRCTLQTIPGCGCSVVRWDLHTCQRYYIDLENPSGVNKSVTSSSSVCGGYVSYERLHFPELKSMRTTEVSTRSRDSQLYSYFSSFFSKNALSVLVQSWLLCLLLMTGPMIRWLLRKYISRCIISLVANFLLVLFKVHVVQLLWLSAFPIGRAG